MDLYNEVLELIEQQKSATKRLIHTGREYGKAMTDARVALREELLRLVSQGRPVTNLYYIARGAKSVAEAKFKEIEKEAIYKANQEYILVLKLEARIKEKQLEREWYSPENQ